MTISRTIASDFAFGGKPEGPRPPAAKDAAFLADLSAQLTKMMAHVPKPKGDQRGRRRPLRERQEEQAAKYHAWLKGEGR
jgi:hypothetical protein